MLQWGTNFLSKGQRVLDLKKLDYFIQSSSFKRIQTNTIKFYVKLRELSSPEVETLLSSLRVIVRNVKEVCGLLTVSMWFSYLCP